ncbi:5-hydroxytryptamine receptor 1A-alpha-like [Dendronephthya gigantea]|uniref:5-hydroxytryptamine receptor 1A-alpha-like n=1 Tax=Dendronephthya gigantea TaxID=151771 RepID=UPI001069AE11|nr:5-hydroxytryptamine receptor 1A-alpha-like [Dendronephthya gigantea]XP_028391598.1 5-hydroxytryptamine receptor 1A-alpha-like [Dendronephthya gigantea]XP_028391599.1 5-hydroxytryptamine receptor 1A-alpha-like [Dendronephthya gigantea]XP_028391600.1 5-hydroxytryptamine receptor 1A-alpha-like [Dendronephthya gigantea]XP_028391601.1 5-hydroxytryptamine receptor 1A-alpha-like [Dendronephthya gigantea]XP_028391602.1 5-hydroxytryptamine receptor 1A-alpha-like [Dendronephthya gigantea]XP_02839160
MSENATSSSFATSTELFGTFTPTTLSNNTLINTTVIAPGRNNTLPPHQTYSESYKIISATIIFAIMALSIFGNSLVVIAFRRYHKLRTVTNYFVVSLAISDILISMLSMPTWAIHVVTGPDPNWEKIDRSALVVWTLTDIICGLTSIFNLTCISIERYICISSPLRYYQRMGGRRAIIIIACMWVFATLLAASRGIFQDTVVVFEVMFTVIGFFIPLLIMVIMYSMIFRVACKQVKKIDIPMNGGTTKKFRLRKEIKAAKTLGIVISAFFICWSPFFVLNFYAICRSCYASLRQDIIIAAKWFHYVNSVLNPLIYARMNKDFRDGFTRILLQCALRVGIRDDINESDLPALDRRSSSMLASVAGRRRKSSTLAHGSFTS